MIAFVKRILKGKKRLTLDEEGPRQGEGLRKQPSVLDELPWITQHRKWAKLIRTIQERKLGH